MAELSLPLARGAVASLLASSELVRASAALSAILTAYPRDYRSAVLVGRLAWAQGEPAKAFLSFQQAAEADPEYRPAREGMAACGGEEGSVVLGDLPPLGSAGNGSSRPAISAVALGHLYLRQLLLTHCTAQLTPLWHSHRQRLDVGVALAEAHWRLRETEAAEAVCRELLEMAPENLKANLILAQQAWAAGQRAVAEPYLDRARAVDPENELAEALYEWLRVRDEALVPLRYTPLRVAVPDGVPVAAEAPVSAEGTIRFWTPAVGVPVAGQLGVLRRGGIPAEAAVPLAPAVEPGPAEAPAATAEPREPGEPVAAGRGVPPAPAPEPVHAPADAGTDALEPLQREAAPAEPAIEDVLLPAEAAAIPAEQPAAHAEEPQPTEASFAEPPAAARSEGQEPAPEVAAASSEPAPELAPLQAEEPLAEPRLEAESPLLEREPARQEVELAEPTGENALPQADVIAAEPPAAAPPEPKDEPVTAETAEPTLEELEPERPTVEEPVLDAPLPVAEAEPEAAVATTAPEPAVEAVEPAREVRLVEVSARGAVGAARNVGGATARAGATWDHSCRALGQAWRLGALVSSSVESEHGAAQLLHGADGVDVLAVAPPGANLGLLRTALRRGQASSQETH